MKVVLASRNRGKAREFARLLGTSFQLKTLPAGFTVPEETGLSFAENARLKALALFEKLAGEQAVLADDSGLEVTALGGRPGVRSARFAGEGASDADNVAKLLTELRGVRDRRARFVCALCLVVPDAAFGTEAGKAGLGLARVGEAEPGLAGGGELARSSGEARIGAPRLFEVTGVTEGTIVEEPRGSEGFGYDPVFRPRGWAVTLAEATPQDKDRVSHRGAAARALLEELGRAGGLVRRTGGSAEKCQGSATDCEVSTAGCEGAAAETEE